MYLTAKSKEKSLRHASLSYALCGEVTEQAFEI